ncbi:MFS transporter [Nocardiopsis tropica]|uniref:MFS transporter n=1 Tax=Nocardiopsis tropica TaxID=109330 RepID=A0ABV1ZYP7_9ACTN
MSRRRKESPSPARAASAAASRTWTPLLALALGAFAIGCTEFVVVGLLPQISVDLGVPEGAVGQLVTLNAVAVALGAPLLGAAMARYAGRPVLVASLLVFGAAHAVAAAAPTFAVLLATRLVTGACFGLYLAVGFGAAARLAAPGARARALAVFQGGITTATALGSPLGMLLERGSDGTEGWRLPFLAIAVLSGLAALAVLLAVPGLAPLRDQSLRERFAVLARKPVALGITAVAVFWAGTFCAFTYLLPLLREEAGLEGLSVVGVLLLAGVLGVAGNAVGGRGADRARGATLVAAVAAALAGLVLLFATASFAVAAVAVVGLWQLAAWSFVPAVQARIYELGGDAGDAAVSFSVAAFNAGIVLGAGLGGIALETAGLAGVGLSASVLTGLALVLTVLLVRFRPGEGPHA